MRRSRAALGSVVFTQRRPRSGSWSAGCIATCAIRMYLAVGATIVAQALALGRPLLLAYAAAFGAVVAAFVWGYEEPTLSARYGEEYAAYRRAVPAWWPRLRPWRPEPRQR